MSHEALKTRVHRIWSALVGDPTDSSLSLPQMVARLDETVLGHSATDAANETLNNSHFPESMTTPTSGYEDNQADELATGDSQSAVCSKTKDTTRTTTTRPPSTSSCPGSSEKNILPFSSFVDGSF